VLVVVQPGEGAGGGGRRRATAADAREVTAAALERA
jgi:hypothetical protein